MSGLVSHAFEDHLVRSFQREDGEYCFVAKDVCSCLELTNPSKAVSALDEDESGVTSSYVRSDNDVVQKREVLYVTESGLYTLIMRSKKAVTPGTVQHRFRKWVTGEVLPSLRRTGRYEVEGEDIPEPPDTELSVKLALVRETRLTFGREAAQAIWHQIGLPYMAQARVEPDDHPVDEFIESCTFPAPGNLVSSADFRAAYKEWAERNGKPALNMCLIGRRVRSAGVRKVRPGGDSRHYYYTDIALVPSETH